MERRALETRLVEESRRPISPRFVGEIRTLFRRIGYATALIVSLVPCAGSARPGPLTFRWNYDAELTPDYLSLEIRNQGPTATCLPDIHVRDYHNVKLRQNGADVLPHLLDNRAVLEWRGTDLISGFIVIPPGHRVQLLYHLTDWLMKPAPTTASLVVPAYDCLTFFRTRRPKPVLLKTSYSFEPSPAGRKFMSK